MFRHLEHLHPLNWHAKLPDKRWDVPTKKYVFPPRRAADIAAQFEVYLLGELSSYALRILNLDWWPDEDAFDSLCVDLQRHAISAGMKIGVTFPHERVAAREVLHGQLSRRWLRRASRKAAAFAMKVWDPNEALRRHDAAVRGGRKSSRAIRVDLPEGSIRAQMEALNCSRSTIARMRRRAKAVAA